MKLNTLASLLLLTLPLAAETSVSPVGKEIRTGFNLDPFYKKQILVGPFPLVSSENASDAALAEAAVIVNGMLSGREDILAALADAKIRLTVMAASERTTDVPEHSDLEPAEFWDKRARGLGPTRERPSISCGEENLLNLKGDPYPQENILVHEFAHAIHLTALDTLDPTFDQRLKDLYTTALADGKWKGTYAAENHAEYWAEAVQSWFGTNRENDAIHNHVNTPEELTAYDPPLAALCREIFGKTKWQYRRADDPAREDEPHLKSLDRGTLPEFKWESED